MKAVPARECLELVSKVLVGVVTFQRLIFPQPVDVFVNPFGDLLASLT